MTRAALLLLLSALAVGCAPTVLSPSIIRVNPGDPTQGHVMMGVQTGPRLSAPYSTSTGSNPFEGDRNSFSLQQWSLSYDLDFEKAITPEVSAHFGAQGEIYYPFPLPGYGVYVGASYFKEWGRLSLAPAVSLRGATDFGIPGIGGPGTIAGAELTATLAVQSDEGVKYGVTPFASVNRVVAPGAEMPSFYAGFAFFMHLERTTSSLQAIGGFGRVMTPGERSWNSPIIGFRGGR